MSPTLSFYAIAEALLGPGLAHGSQAASANMNAPVLAVDHHALRLYVWYPTARGFVGRMANVKAITGLLSAHITYYRHAIISPRALY